MRSFSADLVPRPASPVKGEDELERVARLDDGRLVIERIRGIGLGLDTDRVVELIEDHPVFGIRHQRDRQVAPRDARSVDDLGETVIPCLLYTSPSPRDLSTSRMPSSA